MPVFSVTALGLAEVEYERRNGYGYYTYEPQTVLDAYPAWKLKIGEQ